jgi:adenylosuccinate synthase
MINGVTKIVMTKADVLDGFGELKICTAYKVGGETTSEIPFQMNRLQIEPVLESLPGWKSDVTSLKKYDNLPEKMKEYVQFINKYLGVKIAYISNGPGRDQLIEI